MKKLSFEEKVGQLFFPAAFINDTDENIRALEDLIRQYSIGGLTFFHSPEMAATNYEKKINIPKNENSRQRLQELIQHYQSISKYPLLISIDAEWGLAMRVENTEQYPYALSLGAVTDPYLVFETGEAIGKDLKAAGIHLNLAPVMDINLDPANPVIGYRSFGQHRERVTDLALAFYRGMRSVGILGCAKHFPGHGDTAVDSHLGLPIIDKTEAELFEQELYPFVKAIELGIDCIMPGHLAVPVLNNGDRVPSSLSGNIVTDLLRKRLGYTGLIITDALNMRAVSEMFEQPGELELAAVRAGNDVLSFSKNIPAAIELITQQCSKKQLEQTFERIDLLKEKAGLFSHSSARKEPVILNANETGSLKERLAGSIITIVKEGAPLSETSSEKIACLSLNKTAKNSAFCKTVSGYKSIPIYEMVRFSKSNSTILKESLDQYERLIVALYIPSIKPQNKFGLDQKLLDWLNTTMRRKNVSLVVFGNPYSLGHIDFEIAGQVIMAYQDMNELEVKAAEFLFGNAEVSGRLPVSIDKAATDVVTE